MAAVGRSEVLALYRSLYRTRQAAFRDDKIALAVSLQKLRSKFRENKHEADSEIIATLVKVGEEVNHLLKHHVVQCQLNENGNYEMNIRKDTTLIHNAVHPDDLK